METSSISASMILLFARNLNKHDDACISKCTNDLLYTTKCARRIDHKLFTLVRRCGPFSDLHRAIITTRGQYCTHETPSFEYYYYIIITCTYDEISRVDGVACETRKREEGWSLPGNNNNNNSRPYPAAAPQRSSSRVYHRIHSAYKHDGPSLLRATLRHYFTRRRVYAFYNGFYSNTTHNNIIMYQVSRNVIMHFEYVFRRKRQRSAECYDTRITVQNSRNVRRDNISRAKYNTTRVDRLARDVSRREIVRASRGRKSRKKTAAANIIFKPN